MRKPSKAKRARIQTALELAQATQTEFWNALGELEGALGWDVDGLAETDLDQYDVDTILEFAKKNGFKN